MWVVLDLPISEPIPNHGTLRTNGGRKMNRIENLCPPSARLYLYSNFRFGFRDVLQRLLDTASTFQSPSRLHAKAHRFQQWGPLSRRYYPHPQAGHDFPLVCLMALPDRGRITLKVRHTRPFLGDRSVLVSGSPPLQSPPHQWTLLTKVETSCDRILIAGGANVEAEWEQGPAV